MRRRVCWAMLSPAERERNIFRLAWSRPGSLSNPRRETLTPPTNSSASTRNSSDTRSTARDHRTPSPIATEHPTRCSHSSRASDRPEICRADQSEAQQRRPTQDRGQHISERNIGQQVAARHVDRGRARRNQDQELLPRRSIPAATRPPWALQSRDRGRPLDPHRRLAHAPDRRAVPRPRRRLLHPPKPRPDHPTPDPTARSARPHRDAPTREVVA